MANEETFESGDRVEWNGPGKIRGVVKRKLTEPMEFKGHHVAASKDDPQDVVESDETDERAAHKSSALRKLSD